MDILGAAHRIGHDFLGGMDALGPLMGCNPRVLNNKLNPACHSHHLTLVEAMRLQQITGRHDVLFAEANLLGFVCIPRPEVADIDITSALAHACSEFGDYMKEADKSLKDGRVTLNEVKRLEKELTDLISAATALQGAIISKGRGRP